MSNKEVNYWNPITALGAAVGGVTKIVYDAPTDLANGWDAAWDETPIAETPTTPATKPTAEQIQAQIDKLTAMKAETEPKTTES